MLVLMPEHGQLVAQSYAESYPGRPPTCTARTRLSPAGISCAGQSRDEDADDAGELAMSTACSSGPIDAVARLLGSR